MSEKGYPADWGSFPLRITARVFTDGDWIESPYITDHGIRLIQTGNVGTGRFLDKPESQRFISPASFRQLGCKWVEPNDLLICRMADPIGRACQVPASIGRSVTAVDCTIYRPDPEIADAGYMLQRLNSAVHLRATADLAGGSTRQRISRGNLGSIEIPLPPLAEQRRIAEILDTVDKAIHKTEEVIAKLEQMKQGLLHDLLTRGIDENGELRDPERHPERFKDSQLGRRIPMDWVVQNLEDCSASGISNGVFKEPERVGSGVPLINVSDLYESFGVDLDACERFAATDVERVRFGVAPGDVFFTRSSLNLKGIAHCNVLRTNAPGVVYECHLMRVRPAKHVIRGDYLALWCRSDFARRFFMGRAKQTTMTTIAQTDIAPLPVAIPSLAEQERIVTRFDIAQQRVQADLVRVEKLDELKRALMDDLLTGRVRVSVDDHEEEK